MYSEIKNVLKDLVSIPTVTGDKKAMLESFLYIKKYLEDTPVYISEYQTNSKHPFMYVSTKKTKRPNILLAAHMDVVAADKSLFKMKQKNKSYIGRGVFDMKFAIAIYLVIFKFFYQDIKDKNVAFLITTDEEIGGHQGTKKFLDLGFKPKVCFLPDGGNDWNWNQKEKGVWQFKVVARGVSAHGSRPWMGINAIALIQKFCHELDILFDNKEGDLYNPASTYNIGKINGGTTVNAVPDYAEAFFDVRFLSNIIGIELKKKVKRLLKSHENLYLENIIFESASDFMFSQSHKHFFSIVKKRCDIMSNPCISHGASDARFFARKGIDCIVTRPKGGDIHSDKEWIDIEDLNRLSEVLHRFVASL